MLNGIALAEGDICLGPADEMKKSNDVSVIMERAAAEKMRESEAMTEMPMAAGVIAAAQYRWPNCTIPYIFDPSLSDQAKVTNAMSHWTLKTGFKFKARANEADYVRFFDDGTGSLWSYVGRRGGKQDICLGNGFSFGNAVHEIGHSIGYYHEQSRNDRNTYVTINWQNIPQNVQHNFAQYLNSGQDVGAYDYCSIMHYPRTAFSINGQDTITPLKPGAECMGQRTALSPGDIAAIKVMYPDCAPIVVDPCRKYLIAARNCQMAGNQLCYFRNMVAYVLCKYRFTKDLRYLRLYRIYRAKYGPPGPIPKGLLPTPETEIEIELEPLGEMEPEIEEEFLDLPLEEEVELEAEEETLEEEMLPPEEEAEAGVTLGITTCLGYRTKALRYLNMYKLKHVKVYLCYFYRFAAAYFCCLYGYTKNKYHYMLCQLYTRRYRECMKSPT